MLSSKREALQHRLEIVSRPRTDPAYLYLLVQIQDGRQHRVSKECSKEATNTILAHIQEILASPTWLFTWLVSVQLHILPLRALRLHDPQPSQRRLLPRKESRLGHSNQLFLHPRSRDWRTPQRPHRSSTNHGPRIRHPSTARIHPRWRTGKYPNHPPPLHNPLWDLPHARRSRTRCHHSFDVERILPHQHPWTMSRSHCRLWKSWSCDRNRGVCTDSGELRR